MGQEQAVEGHQHNEEEVGEGHQHSHQHAHHEHHHDHEHHEHVEGGEQGDWWSTIHGWSKAVSEWAVNLEEQHDEGEVVEEGQQEPKKIEVIPMPLVFGIPLTEVLQREKNSQNFPNLFVPLVVYHVVEFILRDDDRIKQQGIFRVSGCRSEVNTISARYDRGEIVDLEAERISVHEATSLLKKYLQSLPMTLVPRELLPPKNDEITPEALKKILDIIPGENLVLLEFLVTFLKKVIAQSDSNLMTHPNLCVSFGPSLIPIPATETNMNEILGSTKQSIEIASLLLKFSDFVFENLPESRRQIISPPLSSLPPTDLPPFPSPPTDEPPSPNQTNIGTTEDETG